MKEKLMRLKPTKRKLMQLYFALLFNANFKGFSSGNIYQGPTKQLCVPGINCYSCPGAIGACPLGSLQGALSSGHNTLFYVGGILLLYCILFGRMICGWLCPFGLIQELLHKIPTPKLKKGPVTRLLSWLKYAILVFFVFIIPIMYAFRDIPLPAFCKYICPAGTLEGGIGLLSNAVNDSYFSMLGPLFTWKFLLLISIVVGSVFIFRLFCRFICPLGALYGIFNRFSIFGVKLDQKSCVDCGKCISHCKVDIKHVGDQECISCGECISVCPTNAISWKGPKILLPKNEVPAKDDPKREEKLAKQKKQRTVTRAITAIVMLAVLIGAVAYYWNSAPAVTADVGYEVGDLCVDDALQIVTPDGITDNTIIPAETGKITIVNFWGTWCTPCVNELPYFDQIASEYADEVTVVAIHSSMGNNLAPEYVGKYYSDSNIVFATDYALDDTGLVGGFYSALGGRGTYPYTVVLDENGIIVEIFVSSLEYEDLKTVVEGQLN